MALYDIEGKLKQKLGAQSGTSAKGPWAKQDFIIEVQDGRFPTDVCITAWGQDKVADLGNYQVGDTLKLSFGVSSREYNGRWYTELRLWKFGTPGQATVAAPVRQAAPPMPAAPAPTIEDMPADDFPF